jgi:DNA helicase II / ATP-dependent DNA helicase PcrA
MAAARLSFPDLYAALNDDAPLHLKEGLKDGSAWPLRVFLKFLLPLALAVREGRQFEVVSLLRSECPLLSAAGLAGNNASEILNALRVSTEELSTLMHANDADLRTVLEFAFNSQLLAHDEDWRKYFELPTAELAADTDPETPNVLAFLACRVSELHGYRHYLEDMSPFATQQGVKGAEFERVLVLIDDEEGSSQRLFSYEKYFGIAPLSDKDRENIESGADNVVDRTRRLFYVCCSRATRDLAVVMFVRDIASARRNIEGSEIFGAEDIVEESAL